MSFELVWLPDVLQAAGLKVAVTDGWMDRGVGPMGEVRGIVCHHTATQAAGNMPTLELLKSGRSDLAGPLAHLGLGRDGTYYVIAAGRANHAGAGSWQGITTGNTSFIGIEAENDGVQPWPDIQMQAYAHGAAALLRHCGRGAIDCAGHKEYALPAGRKIDPNFDMAQFRLSLQSILDGVEPAPVPIPAQEGEGGQGRPTVRRGDAGDAVAALQRALGLPPDGTFGPAMEAAVRQFQRGHGLVPDGIVGPKTWQAVPAPGAQ